MKKTITLLSLIFIPITAFALQYERQSLLYTDAPFSPAEAAGISVLTSIDAVNGYPDGTFKPSRTINRAEFLKIALASHPSIRVSSSDSSRCFSDVKRDDWFSQYVCLAKKREIINGYPDGTFKPERSVNYAEALKILGELYEYTAFAEPDAQWFAIYVQAAKNHKTILPIEMTYDRLITRGQMTRLAAAYRAEYEGELDLYRSMETGRSIASSSSSQSSYTEFSSDISSSSSAPIAENNEFELPIESQILILDKRYPIADAMLYVRNKDAHIRILKVFLEREARSIKKLFISDKQGNQIAELKLDVTDWENETWKVELPGGTGSFVISADEGTPIVIEAEIRGWNDRGFSQDWIELKKMYIIVEKAGAPNETYQVVPSQAHYPVHQTATSKVINVQNSLIGTGRLLSGINQQMAVFTFKGEDSGGLSRLQIENLKFTLDKSEDVSVSNVSIKSDGTQKHTCSQSSDEPIIIECLAIPYEIGGIDGVNRTIELYADVDTSGSMAGDSLQVLLLNPGSLSDRGDVIFSDGTASFLWIESEAPISSGKVWLQE